MTSPTMAEPASAGVDRYRRTEAALWRYHGIEPTERYVALGSPACRLRVLDVGAGEPLLFVHGTVGPGGWPSLVQALPGYRCLLLDRPGWGGSTPVDFTRHPYAATVSDIVRGVLDSLDIERATVVGGSIGKCGLTHGAAIPERWHGRSPRRFTAGAGGAGSRLHPAGGVPARSADGPVAHVTRPDPLDPHDSGHGPSLAEGRIPMQFLEWRRRPPDPARCATSATWSERSCVGRPSGPV